MRAVTPGELARLARKDGKQKGAAGDASGPGIGTESIRLQLDR